MEKMIRVECTGAATIPLEQIVPLQGDLKTISPDKMRKLKKSIVDFGISSPTQIWQDQDNGGTCYTLDGHQRMLAYKSLQADGWTVPEIPIVYVESKDKDEAYEKLLIATSSYGEFSAAGVQKYVQQLKNQDRIKNTVNLSNVNLDRIFAILNAQTDPDEVPEPVTEPPITQNGDLWLLGQHRLVCGDSRDKSVIDRLMNGEKCKLILTDAPYGISYQPNWRQELDFSSNRKDGLVVNDDICVFEETFKNLDADVVYYFHAAVKSLEVLQSFIGNLDYSLRSQLVWVKQSAPIGRSHWSWQHEPIFYLVKNGRSADWTSTDHKARTVINCANQNPFGGTFTKNDFNQLTADLDTRTSHSTQKPVMLLQEIIKRHNQDGDIIVDPFMGSGSTLIACHTLNRRCFGTEISEQFCDIILNRYSAFTNDDPIRESDGAKLSEIKSSLETKGE